MGMGWILTAPSSALWSVPDMVPPPVEPHLDVIETESVALADCPIGEHEHARRGVRDLIRPVVPGVRVFATGLLELVAAAPNLPPHPILAYLLDCHGVLSVVLLGMLESVPQPM